MSKPAVNLEIKPFENADLISYQEGSVVSREIISAPNTTVTLFAFAADQGLSEHTTPFNALVQIIDGEAQITIGGQEHIVKSGQLIIMPANIPHSLKAKKSFKMILTMAKE